jgi:hypothetical protein
LDIGERILIRILEVETLIAMKEELATFRRKMIAKRSLTDRGSDEIS